MLKRQTNNPKHSPFRLSEIANVIRRVFQRSAHELRTETEEEINAHRMPGSVYEYGCSDTADAIISKDLNKGGNYPGESLH